MKRFFMAVVGCLFAVTVSSYAAVTPIRFYHLGEDDAGVGQSVIATNSIDSVSTNSLTLTGAPKYWAHAAPANTNSTYSILFSVDDEGTAAVVTNTDNVCLEAWANSGWRDSHVVVYNGDSTNNGYGIILSNDTYLVVLGGVGNVAAIPCPPGSWMHLAMVCSNGTVAVFTNGTLAAHTSATPIPPTGHLFIGGPNSGTLGFVGLVTYEFTHGFVDDVRFSTFAAGTFNPTNLLYARPVLTPLSIRRSGNNIMLSVTAGKNLERLQTITDLTSANWQNADAPEVLALEQSWTNSIQGTANFYRLNPAGGSPVPVVVVDPSSANEPVSVSNPSVFEPASYYPAEPEYTVPGTYLVARDPNSLDASHFVDLLSDSTNTLSYHWSVFTSEANGGFAYGGLPNYDSPVLQLPASVGDATNCLPDTQDPTEGSDPDALYWRVRLVVHHIPYTPGVGQETVFWLRFQYVGSLLDATTVHWIQPPLEIPLSFGQ